MLEVTAVENCPIACYDFALPVVLASEPRAFIQCSICKLFSALSCDLPCEELTIIDVTVFILHLAFAVIHTAFPFAYVTITIAIFPAAFTLSLPINEHAHEYLIVRRRLLALSIWLVIGILAFDSVRTSGIFS